MSFAGQCVMQVRVKPERAKLTGMMMCFLCTQSSWWMVTCSPDVICGMWAAALAVYSNEVLKRQMLPLLQGLLEMLCVCDVSFHSGADVSWRVIITARLVPAPLDCVWLVHCSHPFIYWSILWCTWGEKCLSWECEHYNVVINAGFAYLVDTKQSALLLRGSQLLCPPSRTSLSTSPPVRNGWVSCDAPSAMEVGYCVNISILSNFFTLRSRRHILWVWGSEAGATSAPILHKGPSVIPCRVT